MVSALQASSLRHKQSVLPVNPKTLVALVLRRAFLVLVQARQPLRCNLQVLSRLQYIPVKVIIIKMTVQLLYNHLELTFPYQMYVAAGVSNTKQSFELREAATSGTCTARVLYWLVPRTWNRRVPSTS